MNEFVNENLFGADRSARTGYWVVGFFLFCFVVWGVVIPTPAATLATGTITAAGSNNLVQHLDGGIVDQILVENGSTVLEGDPVLVLNRSALQAEVDALALSRQQAELAAARASSETVFREELLLSAWMERRLTELPAAIAVASEKELLEQNLRTFEAERTALAGELSKLDEEIQGVEVKAGNLRSRLAMVATERREYRGFHAAGLVTRRHLFDLDQEVSEIELEQDENEARLAVLQEERERTARELFLLKNSFVSRATAERNQQSDLAANYALQLQAAEQKLDRSVLRAPVSGTVVNLAVHTRGGVIAAGQHLMEIVPSGNGLRVQAIVDPRDRESVRVGQPAEVRFTAFSQRYSTPVRGVVETISADSVEGVNATQRIYLTDIVLEEDPKTVLGTDQIHPGMQTEVIILTGERTLFQYLFQPLTRSFTRALKEA